MLARIVGLIAVAVLMVSCKDPQGNFQKANAAVSISANALANEVQALSAAGVIDDATAKTIVAWDGAIAKASADAAAIVAQPGTWSTKVPALTAVVTALPGPLSIQRAAGLSDVQYTALISAVTGVEATVQIVIAELR